MAPIKVLCITLGGERQAAITSMFGDHPDFAVSFHTGIESRSLSSKKGLLTSCYKAGILSEDPALTIFADPPVASSQQGEWTDMDYPLELWKKGKYLARERSVLACLLAHLTAQRFAVDNGFDVIIEDNVRTLSDLTLLAAIMRQFIKDSASSECRFFGYLGPADNLQYVHEKHTPEFSTPGSLAVPYPFKTIHYEVSPETMLSTPLWGAYAYMPSRRGHDAIVKRLQTDIGALFWRGKRMRAFKCKPVDKTIPRVLFETGLTDLSICKTVCFFRAPMLQSKIHRKYDHEFCKSTEFQLTKVGLKWEDLFLLPAEQETIKVYRSTGSWGEELVAHELNDSKYEHKSETNGNVKYAKKKKAKDSSKHVPRVNNLLNAAYIALAVSSLATLVFLGAQYRKKRR